MSKLQTLIARLKSKKAGQGVIEYLGALCIAALIVVAVVTIGGPTMNNLYNQFFAAIATFFGGQFTSI